jgi:hypothetical protein
MSGGWQRSFTLDAPTEVVLSFRYRLTQAPDYESGEYGHALVSADGTFYGAGGRRLRGQVVRDGNGGSERTTGWQLFEVNLGTLSAGEHVLTVGGYNNKRTCRDEFTEVLVDNVVLAE